MLKPEYIEAHQAHHHGGGKVGNSMSQKQSHEAFYQGGEYEEGLGSDQEHMRMANTNGFTATHPPKPRRASA